MPKRIKVGNIPYEVRYGPANLGSDPDWDDDKDEGRYYGGINHEKQIIFINKEATDERKRAAILHELLHGLSVEYAIELSEGQVKCIANSLMAAFSDNPWVAKEILGG